MCFEPWGQCITDIWNLIPISLKGFCLHMGPRITLNSPIGIGHGSWASIWGIWVWQPVWLSHNCLSFTLWQHRDPGHLWCWSGARFGPGLLWSNQPLRCIDVGNHCLFVGNELFIRIGVPLGLWETCGYLCAGWGWKTLLWRRDPLHCRWRAPCFTRVSSSWDDGAGNYVMP